MGVMTLISPIEKDDKRISILMNTNILKSGGCADRTNFDKHLELLKFTITREHSQASCRVVKGICYTPDCDNPYEKSYKDIAKKTGPFCIPCIRGSSLLRQYPEIAKSIVKCDVPISQLCCMTKKKVVFQCQEKCLRCQEKCLRCQKNHEYEMSVSNRVLGYNCAICRGMQKCFCQKDDEFRCSVCKHIKSKTQCSYGTICKICDSQKFDNH
jgi:hypothetical protein